MATQLNKLSIVLCTYNGGAFLKEQLASIENQTRLPDEIIICDDRSIDSTLKIIAAFSERATFPVHWMQNEINLGSTKNFEKGIKLAKGDIIFLADQDDIWYPTKLATIEKIFNDNPASGYVFSNGDILYKKALREVGIWESIGWGGGKEKSFLPHNQVLQLLKENVVTGATMAFRKDLVPLVTPIPSSWVHDAWIALVASSCGAYGIALPDKLIMYRQHQGQQIGPGGGWIRRFLQLVGRIGGSQEKYLGIQWARFEMLRMHLSTLQQHAMQVDGAMALVKAKLDHLSVRYANSHRGVPPYKRALGVWREYRSGRYHSFSRGGLAALKDLL